jgi:hypothetical protein
LRLRQSSSAVADAVVTAGSKVAILQALVAKIAKACLNSVNDSRSGGIYCECRRSLPCMFEHMALRYHVVQQEDALPRRFDCSRALAGSDTEEAAFYLFSHSEVRR